MEAKTNRTRDQESEFEANGIMNTPLRDVPSLTFGNSSSPFFDSPRTMLGSSNPAEDYKSPRPNAKNAFDSPDSPYTQIMSNHFPTNELTMLQSSPPTSNFLNNIENIFRSPLRQPEPVIAPPFDFKALDPEPRYVGGAPSVLAPRTLPVGPQGVENPATKGQPRRDSVMAGNNLNGPAKRRHHGGENRAKRTHTRHCGRPTLLLPSQVFTRACECQRSLLQTVPLSKLKERRESAAKADGCFNSNIDKKGRVFIDFGAANVPFPDEPSPSHQSTQGPPQRRKSTNEKFYDIAELVGSDDLLGESDTEDRDQYEDMLPKTPPRFGNLGSCDAATAFAKTLARSRDQGRGSLFMFPSYDTPDNARLTSYVPCTPRIPSEPSEIDASVLRNGVMTPPSAIYSYEHNSAFTGLTPFLVGDQER